MSGEANGIRSESSRYRDSNLELFRILSMFLIVMHHYVVNSGLTDVQGPIYAGYSLIRSMFVLVCGAWGKTGINCFVLITGYFMCESRITLKKFVKLLAEIMFYRIIIAAVFWLTGYEEFTVNGFLNTIIPIRRLEDNFTSCFLVFYLFVPFLSLLVHHLTEKQHIRLIVLCTFMYVLFGTLRPFFSVTMNYVSWFFVLFVIASYLRLYPKKLFENQRRMRIILSVLILLDILSVIGLFLVGRHFKTKMAYALVTDSNTLLAVLTGIAAFLYFKNTIIKYNRIINLVGASTFGVLLIHASSDTMRKWLWQDVLRNTEVFYRWFMPIHVIGSVACVFICCTIIDYLRIQVLERPFLCFWDRIEPTIVSAFRREETKLLSKMGIRE